MALVNTLNQFSKSVQFAIDVLEHGEVSGRIEAAAEGEKKEEEEGNTMRKDAVESAVGGVETTVDRGEGQKEKEADSAEAIHADAQLQVEASESSALSRDEVVAVDEVRQSRQQTDYNLDLNVFLTFYSTLVALSLQLTALTVYRLLV